MEQHLGSSPTQIGNLPNYFFAKTQETATAELATNPQPANASSAEKPDLITAYLIAFLTGSFMLAFVLSLASSSFEFWLSFFQGSTVWQELQRREDSIVRLRESPETCGIFLSYTNSEDSNRIFGIPTEIEVVVPELDARNHLIYDMNNYWELTDIEIPSVTSVKIKIFKDIAPIVKQRFETNTQIETVKKYFSKVQEMNSLVQTSELYSNYSEVYKTALQQHSVALEKLYQLQHQLDNYVRESLVAVKIAEFEATDIAFEISELNNKLQTLQQNYQETKDFIREYLDLKYHMDSSEENLALYKINE